MMRYFILLIFLCSVAEAQSIVISGDRRSMVVSGRSAPVVTKPIVVEPVKTIVHEPIVTPKPVQVIQRVKTRTRYLVSEEWCANCPRRKELFKRNGWPEENIITIAECRRRFGFTVPHVPYEFIEPEVVQGPREDVKPSKLQDSPLTIRNSVWGQQPDRISKPNRYIQWPGWGQIDLETYNRNCNCGMCQSIRAYQQEYRRQLQLYNQQSRADPAFKASQEATPTDVVDKMIRAMNLTSKDVLADLGCGDGRILIRAVQMTGCTGVGIEIDPVKSAEALTNVRASGLSGSIQIITADALDFEPAKYGVTAITAHLYEPLLEKLRPKLEQVRIVASPYHQVPGMTMVQVDGVWIHDATL